MQGVQVGIVPDRDCQAHGLLGPGFPHQGAQALLEVVGGGAIGDQHQHRRQGSLLHRRRSQRSSHQPERLAHGRQPFSLKIHPAALQLIHRRGLGDMPAGLVGKTDGAHEHLRFRVLTGHLRHAWQGLANGLIEGLHFAIRLHRARAIAEVDEVQGALRKLNVRKSHRICRREPVESTD